MTKAFLQKLQVDGHPLPDAVVDDILTQAGQELEAAQAAVREWEEKFQKSQRDHESALAALEFSHRLDTAVTAAGGRSGKAIRALLDVDALQGSPDQEAAIRQALDGLRREEPYLFREEQSPPPYATGDPYPSRRRYTMEELERLPMDEYRAWREGN